ncbi:DUF1275 family protein [Streptomyces sp. NPDC055254]
MNWGNRTGRLSPTGLMLVLTWVTGLVEAVSLLALGPVFTAMRTGNVLAVAKGLRTVTSMRVNVPGVSTTLITRSMTALLGGSVLGQDSSFGYGTGAWVRRAGAVPAMFAGGLIGALLVRAGWSVGALLLPAAAVVLGVAVLYRAVPPVPGRG